MIFIPQAGRKTAIRLIPAVLLLSASPALADWSAFYRAPAREPAVIAAPPEPVSASPGLPALGGIPALDDIPVFINAATAQRQAEPDLPMELDADAGLCLREILIAQQHHAIPGNLLLAIGLQESGMSRKNGFTAWPWSVNVEGRGRFFETKAEAMQWVSENLASGVQSIDVGCMQVNLRWHPDAFASLDEAFDPRTNVGYSADLLVSLHERTGDWILAAGAYHSATPEKQEIYLASLRQNIAFANDGIEGFRAIALQAQGRPMENAGFGIDDFSGDWDAYLTSLVMDEPVSVPQSRPLWSAGLGEDDGTRIYGLYSKTHLRPVLPAFVRNF